MLPHVLKPKKLVVCFSTFLFSLILDDILIFMNLYNSMSGLRGPLEGHKVPTSYGHKCQSQLLEVSAQRLVLKCEDKAQHKESQGALWIW